MVFSCLGVILGAQIVFLSKGVSVEASLLSHFYSSVLLCIGWLFRIRLLDTDLFQPFSFLLLQEWSPEIMLLKEWSEGML